MRMKLAWPNHRLHRGSRRLISRLSFALMAFLLALGVAVPTRAVMFPLSGLPPQTSLGSEEVQMAQAVNFERDILVFTTPTYSVRVFTPAGMLTPRMNIFRRTSPSGLELSAQPASFQGAITGDGFLTYESFGSRNGRNVIFRASHNRGNRQARLEILDQATEQVIVTEFATGVDAPQMPEAPITGALERNTLLGFETQNYAVRVFRDPADNTRRLNVYYKPMAITLVSSQVATPDRSGTIPNYPCWTSYSGGTQFNGMAARYHVRVSPSGRAVLDIIGGNGMLLLSEPRISTIPLTVNLPSEDRPACFEGGGVSASDTLRPFLAAVFGEDAELEAARRLLSSSQTTLRRPDSCQVSPRFEDAPQGRFINAAECINRHEAAAVVEFLRGQGLNARLVFRNFRYR